uniref:Pre-mRNA splicing helicase n=1 Tax=Encephalitozoon cuniculi TaxID=6035 RepID=M1K8M3_ENCCN|nr:pre-mRNA splicing helicase [Encephalitozoon cuniculi]
MVPMGSEDIKSLSHVDYFEKLKSLVGAEDELVVKKVMEVLCGDVESRQDAIEKILGRSLAKESLESMTQLTERFLHRNARQISFEDVELFDVLLTQAEKRSLLEVIRKGTDLEKELSGALRGSKVYFMRYILANRKLFEYFLVHQLYLDEREKARKLMRGEEGSVSFIKYIDSDALSLMRGSRVIDLEKTSSEHSTHMAREGYPPGSTVKYEDGAKIVLVPGRRVAVEFDGHPPGNVKRLFGEDFMFNYIQSMVQDSVLKGDGNVLVCAPTGSGKTVIGMMSILREAERRKKMRVGYIVPMKALAREICRTISRWFSGYGISVVEHTSDVYSGYAHLERTGVIVSTPEKFDVLTRNTDLWFDLVVIDEIHMVGDSRGAAVEAVVARMAVRGGCRIVGLSATLPNYMDVGAFIGCNDPDIFYFGPEFRKSPIDYEVINVGAREREMDMTIEKVLENLDSNGPVLVFVHSRNEALEVANEIRRYMEKASDDGADVSPEVRELLKHRVGIHHAGLDRKTRVAVEDLYRNGKIDVMVSTATLAWGVNLPGKTVIIKGTEVYDASTSRWRPIKQIEMIQMFGRAGRSGDDGCKGILISSKENEFLVQRSIDSRLLPSLCDCLNAEIVKGMRRFEDMIDWFKHTFYYTRLVKVSREPARMVKELVYSALKLLEDAGLIALEPAIHPTEVGEVSSRYYVHYRDARRLFDGLSHVMLEPSIFQILEKAREFSDLSIDEKAMESLRGLVPIPTESLFGVLLQCYVANRIESTSLSQNLCRMFRALFEIGVRKRLGISKMILGWCKAAEHRIFPYQTPLRQFADDKNALRDLEMKEIPFGMLEILGKEGLDEVGIRGSGIIEHLRYVPRFSISPSVRVAESGYYVISLGMEKAFDDSKVHSNTYYLFITDAEEEELVFCDAIVFEKRCEYVYQNYGVFTGQPFLNICLLSAHYLCPTEPVTLDLRNVANSRASIFDGVWRDFMVEKALGMDNCIRLGLFYDDIGTEVVVVPGYGEKRRLMLLGYRAYTYEEFVSWKITSGPVTILEIHDSISNHLIEVCMAHCIVNSIQMVMTGLPFTRSGGAESVGKIEKSMENVGIEVYESFSLTRHGQLSDFKLRLTMNMDGLDVEKKSCLVICSTRKMARWFMKHFKEAKVASEYTGIHSGIYFATRRVVNLWIDRRWSPQVSQVHIVGTDYYDHETLSWVDYPLADVRRYSLLGRRGFLYLKQSKKALYFGDGGVPLCYGSSGRRELYVYSYWLGCRAEKSEELPLFVKEQELTRYGAMMCRYCVGIDTIELFIERVRDKMGMKSIQTLVCGAGELVFDVDSDEFEALSGAGVDLSRGKAHGMTSYILDRDKRDEWVLREYGDQVLPVVHRVYLCLVEVSSEKTYLKTSFNAMFGLQNVMKAFGGCMDRFYNAKLCGGVVLIEVVSMPRSPMGWTVFFLSAGSREFKVLYADCPGVHSIPWEHKSCYIMNDCLPGFEVVEDEDMGA